MFLNQEITLFDFMLRDIAQTLVSKHMQISENFIFSLISKSIDLIFSLLTLFFSRFSLNMNNYELYNLPYWSIISQRSPNTINSLLLEIQQFIRTCSGLIIIYQNQCLQESLWRLKCG